MGVWERSPKKQRLHFHGIFYIPEGSIPGELLPFKDYSFSTLLQIIKEQRNRASHGHLVSQAKIRLAWETVIQKMQRRDGIWRAMKNS